MSTVVIVGIIFIGLLVLTAVYLEIADWRNERVYEYLGNWIGKICENNLAKLQDCKEIALIQAISKENITFNFNSLMEEYVVKSNNAWAVYKTMNYNKMVWYAWRTMGSFATPEMKKQMLWEWGNENNT